MVDDKSINFKIKGETDKMSTCRQGVHRKCIYVLCSCFVSFRRFCTKINCCIQFDGVSISLAINLPEPCVDSASSKCVLKNALNGANSFPYTSSTGMRTRSGRTYTFSNDSWTIEWPIRWRIAHTVRDGSERETVIGAAKPVYIFHNKWLREFTWLSPGIN